VRVTEPKEKQSTLTPHVQKPVKPAVAKPLHATQEAKDDRKALAELQRQALAWKQESQLEAMLRERELHGDKTIVQALKRLKPCDIERGEMSFVKAYDEVKYRLSMLRGQIENSSESELRIRITGRDGDIDGYSSMDSVFRKCKDGNYTTAKR
jgi:hypothetical protein